VNVARASMPDHTWLADAGASISGSVQCWFHHVLRSVLSPSILAKTLPVLRKNADESARNLRSGCCQRLLNRELRHLLTRSESGAIRVMPPADLMKTTRATSMRAMAIMNLTMAFTP